MEFENKNVNKAIEVTKKISKNRVIVKRIFFVLGISYVCKYCENVFFLITLIHKKI